MKYVFALLLMFVAGAIRAEIKQIQLLVKGETPRTIFYQYKVGSSDMGMSPTGGYVISDQTSNMVPVKNKRIEGFRMPFISRMEHEVLLVGPFLDMCGDISILDEDNNLIGTIRSASFVGKGKDDFFILRDDEFRREGYVKFRIPASMMATIGKRNFKIKVGNVESLDVVECKVVNRYTAEAILFTGATAPTRTAIGSSATTNVLNTFQNGTEYQVKMKLRGGVPADETFQFNNGVDKALIFFRSSCASCDRPYIEGTGSITRGRLFEADDAIVFSVRTTNEGRISRGHGELIAIADGGAGNWNKITKDKEGSFAIGRGPSQENRPEGWGPYLYLREANDIYRFGQYTDLSILQIGDDAACSCPSLNSASTPVGTVIGSTSGGGGAAGGNAAAAPLTLETRNAFRFSSSGSATVADNFGTTANLCLTATDPNPKVTTIGALTAVLRSGTALNNLTVRIKRGAAIIQTVTAVNVAANVPREVAFTRPESRVCVTRSTVNAAVCKRCGDGIQGIALWDDEGITIEVLQANVLLASNTVSNL